MRRVSPTRPPRASLIHRPRGPPPLPPRAASVAHPAPLWSAAVATTDTWRSLRASQWWHFTALPLVTLPDLSPASCRRVPLALLLAACCLAVAYAVNAVTDRRSDRLAAKNPLVRARCLVPSELGPALRHPVPAAVPADVSVARAPTAPATSLRAGLAYSTSVCGKRTPLLGVACNAAIFTPLALLLHPGGPLAPASVAELLLFTLLLAQNQLLHELADAGGGAAAGAPPAPPRPGPTPRRFPALLTRPNHPPSPSPPPRAGRRPPAPARPPAGSGPHAPARC